MIKCDQSIHLAEQSIDKIDAVNKGYEQGRADAIDKIYNYVKRECNPFGKPSLDFESGMKILNYLERLKKQNIE